MTEKPGLPPEFWRNFFTRILPLSLILWALIFLIVRWIFY